MCKSVHEQIVTLKDSNTSIEKFHNFPCMMTVLGVNSMSKKIIFTLFSLVKKGKQAATVNIQCQESKEQLQMSYILVER